MKMKSLIKQFSRRIREENTGKYVSFAASGYFVLNFKEKRGLTEVRVHRGDVIKYCTSSWFMIMFIENGDVHYYYCLHKPANMRKFVRDLDALAAKIGATALRI